MFMATHSLTPNYLSDPIVLRGNLNPHNVRNYSDIHLPIVCFRFVLDMGMVMANRILQIHLRHQPASQWGVGNFRDVVTT